MTSAIAMAYEITRECSTIHSYASLIASSTLRVFYNYGSNHTDYVGTGEARDIITYMIQCASYSTIQET